jgi:hypothetical protein
MQLSLSRLALFGLLALGAGTAGAQTNVLFNVTYDPTSLRLTFTPTGNVVTWTGGSSGSVINSTVGAGIYFENFFSSAPPAGLNGSLVTTHVSGGLQGSIASSSDALVNPFEGGDALNLTRSGLNSGQALNFNFDQAAFTAQPLVIEFASEVEAFMKTSPAFSGGLVSVFATTAIAPQGEIIVLGSYAYSAVPEPSTYAAIAGALGLGYAFYRRRRQAAAAAAAA